MFEGTIIFSSGRPWNRAAYFPRGVSLGLTDVVGQNVLKEHLVYQSGGRGLLLLRLELSLPLVIQPMHVLMLKID